MQSNIFLPNLTLRLNGATPQALSARKFLALNDAGQVLGLDAGAPPDPGLPGAALRAFLCNVSDGSKTDVSTLLPPVYRKQISFDLNSSAQMNSAGDILLTASTLEGSEDKPAWNSKDILWNRSPAPPTPTAPSPSFPMQAKD